ncbi:MAG: substrate-binding domain-containing protein [Dysgonamonadaceae bacterium]|nr:substrate-binding domain-containing protein [Dysgonamonadaceae bacterium]
MKPIVFLSIVYIFAFASCKQKEAKDPWDDTLNSGLIRIACDENFKSLMDAEIAVFEARTPGAIILPVYTNETEAIRLLTEDSVRLALVTRDLTAKEHADIGKRSLTVRTNLIGFDAIALVMNPMNKDSILSMPVLKKILTGEITEWSQIHPDSPIGTIRMIVDNKESAIVRYIVDSITRGTLLTSNIYALGNSEEVMKKVMQMPNAIGIFGVNALNHAQADYKDKIRLVRISNEEPATVGNSYLPYPGDIRAENYPLWRPVYVLLSDPKSGLSSGLSIFLAHEAGQLILLKSGLLPITDPQNKSVLIKDEYPK